MHDLSTWVNGGRSETGFRPDTRIVRAGRRAVKGRDPAGCVAPKNRLFRSLCRTIEYGWGSDYTGVMKISKRLDWLGVSGEKSGFPCLFARPNQSYLLITLIAQKTGLSENLLTQPGR